jgi:hypothetical protein
MSAGEQLSAGNLTDDTAATQGVVEQHPWRSSPSPTVLLRAVERHQPRGLLPGQARPLRRAIVLQAGRGIRGFQWWACICYAITLAVQVPFLDQLFYVGPLVSSLGGADISWIVGFGVASLLYLTGAKRFVHIQPGAAAAVGAAS